jgi:hypothetical protein
MYQKWYEFAIGIIAVDAPHPFVGAGRGIGFSCLGIFPALREHVTPASKQRAKQSYFGSRTGCIGYGRVTNGRRAILRLLGDGRRLRRPTALAARGVLDGREQAEPEHVN